MKAPKIDNRTQKDILEYIKTISANYTPEWKFDDVNVDFGSALSMIYTNMFSETVERFNKVPENNMLSFYNAINADLMPSISATGYVAFALAGDVDQGVRVNAGTKLLADTNDEENPTTVFETLNDIYVTSSKVNDIFAACGKYDYIEHIYNSLTDTPNVNNKELFSLKNENLQHHQLYIYENNVLNIKGSACVKISFSSQSKNNMSKAVLEKLADKNYAIWEYETQDGFIEFNQVKLTNETLYLFKDEGTKGIYSNEDFEEPSRKIRCTVKSLKYFENFNFDKLFIGSLATGVALDNINTAGVDQNLNSCFPFGEKFTLYTDAYFACDEALSKAGSKVKLSFELNFAKIPLDLDVTDPQINWRLIMKRSEFKPDIEYDITIADVIWEYFNGLGWARLMPNDEYNNIFTSKFGTSHLLRTMTFDCPDDMQPIQINSCESRYIRARISKVNNPYKIKGQYISPFIENASFSYDYEEKNPNPQALISINNMEKKTYISSQYNNLVPFYGLENDENSIYLGFEKELSNGPIKILFSFNNNIAEKLPRLHYEFLSQNGWEKLNVIDETENFRKTGIVTLLVAQKMKKTEKFNCNYYWIRITDKSKRYLNKENPVELPVLNGLYINTTNVINKEHKPQETFYIEPFEKNFECKLLNNKVQDIKVTVEEKEGEFTVWQEVENFAFSNNEDRHFTVDRINGIVKFSDDINGKIPPSMDKDNIIIDYSVGGGSIGNLPKNSINRSVESLGFINLIFNPYVTSGGCDEEDKNSAINRLACAIRHNGRAVTCKDYEALAMESGRNISKAKCFSGYNENGALEYGCVTLVALQKDFETGRSFFPNIREQILNYIQKRISTPLVPTEKFKVVEPLFLELSVQVKATVKDFNKVFTAKDNIEKRLNEFINPLTGGFDGKGWQIGTIPNSMQIENALKNLDGVHTVTNVFVNIFVNGKYGKVQTELKALKNQKYALPISGEHQVIISVEDRGDIIA